MGARFPPAFYGTGLGPPVPTGGSVGLGLWFSKIKGKAFSASGGDYYGTSSTAVNGSISSYLCSAGFFEIRVTSFSWYFFAPFL